MAEMHPILWSRVTDRRLTGEHVKVAVLSTFEHRSFELADIPMVFKPQTDLAILNYIANYIIENGAVNEAFVRITSTSSSVTPTSATACVRRMRAKRMPRIPA